LLAAGGDGLQPGFDLGDLGGLAAAFHEQHATGFGRAVVVEIGRPGEGAGARRRRGLDGGPAFGQRDQRACRALQRDGVGQRRPGVVLLVLAVVSRQVRRRRQQPAVAGTGLGLPGSGARLGRAVLG
jgi:hypothetical protein